MAASKYLPLCSSLSHLQVERRRRGELSGVKVGHTGRPQVGGWLLPAGKGPRGRQ